MKTIKNLTADQLRKSILQLAIEGKLVKQNPNDEPASELVKKIMAEKKKLIQEGKIKKDKNESYIFKGDDNCYYEKIGNSGPVKLEDLPFDIPDSWTWIRLKDLIHIQTGASFKKEQSIQEAKSSFVRVLRGGNILPFQFLLKNDDLYIPQELVSNDILLRKNDLITPAVTSLENIGKIAVITNDLINVTAGGFVYIFRPYIDDEILSNLIADYVSSSVYQSMMKDITKKSGQAFYNMNKEKLLQLYFPIAPFAEMIRIVHKVKKCEPLIDEYSLIEDKLSILEEEFPEKIKKSILQYAIEGKLVKQDPNDEPASVLLERIKTEKENLIKEGKIKRDKNESYIYQGDDKNYYEKVGKTASQIDVPSTIPTSWIFARLSSICRIVNGFTPLRSNPDFWENGDINWMTVDDINRQGKYLSLTIQHITNSAVKSDDKIVPSGSTFICCTSATIGKTCINNVPMCSNQQFNGLVIKDARRLNNEFLYYFCSTLKNKLLELAGITTFPFVSVDKLGKILVPVPPLEMQKLIVNKIKMIENLIQPN